MQLLRMIADSVSCQIQFSVSKHSQNSSVVAEVDIFKVDTKIVFYVNKKAVGF